MKRILGFALCVCCSASAFSAANISDVWLRADETAATITYTLDRDAIVTAQIVTNGAPVAAADFSSATGDVNRLVSAGKGRINWTLPAGFTRRMLRKARAVLTAWSTNAPPKYLVVDLIASNTAYYASAEALPAGGLTNDLYRTSKMVFVRIPAGGKTFAMGSAVGVYSRDANREVGHEVTLTQDYWMGVFEITQKQYENVMGENPSVWTSAADSPVRPFDRASFARIRGTGDWPTVKTVSADSLCGRLRQFTGISTFDIPTDAQWEFACKADGAMENPIGAENDSNGNYIYGNIDDYAWTGRNSAIDSTVQTHRVGEKLPNDFGLYDMLGNAWEWVLDFSGYKDTESVTDPFGPSKGLDDGKRIMRGGDYTCGINKARASCRSNGYYSGMSFDSKGHFGVRLVCTFRPAYTVTTPAGTGVRWERDPTNGMVTVAYDLDRDAIVTTDVRTNGVSIGAEHFLRLSGDVNRLVEKGEGRVFRWMPEPDDPDWTVAAGELSIVVTKWDPHAPPDYLAADVAVTNRQLYYVSTNAIPGGIHHVLYKSGMILMKKIPAAGVCFRMGSVSGEAGRVADDEIPHYVTLTNDFYMAVFEMTQQQHYKLGGGIPSEIRNPSTYTNASIRPVGINMGSFTSIRGSTLGLSWPTNHLVDAASPVGRLRSTLGDDRFDLPTEAQWEFACRAGSPYLYGDENDQPNDVSWNWGNTEGIKEHGDYWTHAQVGGQKKPNGYGLYDMHGNVSEVCLDWWSSGETYATGEAVIDPRGPDRTGDYFVKRGGNTISGEYRYPIEQIRSAARDKQHYTNYYSHSAGYRLIRFIGPLPGPFIQ